MPLRIQTLLYGLLLSTQGLFAQVEWVSKLDDALKKAVAENKFVVLDISTSWCPPCQRMARDVYPDREFIDFSRSQVFMLLDAELDVEGARLARRYQVHAYPTILVLDATGREIDRLVGGRDLRELLRDLKQIFVDPLPYPERLARARAQGKDFALQLEVGRKALDRGNDSEAREFLGRAAQLQEAAVNERAAAFALLSIACFKGGKYKESFEAMVEAEKLQPKLIQESSEMQFQKARVLVALKRYEEGYAIAQELLRSSRSRTDRDSAQKLMGQLPSRYRKQEKEATASLQKARESLAKRKTEEALQQALKAGEIIPQSAEVHLLLVAIYFKKSETEADPSRKSELLARGLSELRLARRLDPEDLTGYLAAKNTLAAQYIPVSTGSQEVDRIYHDAEQRFAEGRYDDAMRLYRQVIQRAPKFGKAYLHMGDCFFAKGRVEESLKWYGEAAAQTPLDAAAYRFAADALQKLGRAEEAREQLINSLLADPEYPLIWQHLEETARSEGRRLERHSEIIPFQFLLASVNADSYDESMFDDVPSEAVPAWREYMRNKLLWRQDKFRKTYTGAAFYRTTFEEEYESLYKLVEMWDALKSQTPALKNETLDLLRQVTLDGHLDSFVFLELFTEEYRGAFENWKKADQQKPRAYIEKYLLGSPMTHSRSGYNSSAVESYNAGVELHKAGNAEKAMEQYRKALIQEPNMIPALTNLGMLLLEREDHAGARPLMERWKSLEPHAARPVAILAQIERHDGNLEVAERLIGEALVLATDAKEKEYYEQFLSDVRSRRSPRAQVGPPPGTMQQSPLQGAALALNDGRAEDAIQRLEKLYPTLPGGSDKEMALFMLGLAHLELKRWKEARVYMERLLEMNPNHEHAREALKNLIKMPR